MRWVLAVSLVAVVACSKGQSSGAPDLGTDGGGVIPDAGSDGGIPDAGADAGTDAGVDAGVDGGTDAGTDGGTDAGTDGGITFGTQGPWPVQNQTYGSLEGIQESPVVGLTTDETQNRWVATNAALYLFQPGKSVKRYTAADGLHLPSNPVSYCDTWAPNHECPILGAADAPGISEIVGGGPNEVFVGYYGHHDWSSPDDGTYTDPYRHSGKLDRVRLKADGTLEVVRFDMVSGNTVQFWHNRTVDRMIYDHFKHPHELYVGTDHGVDKFSPDLWHPTNPPPDSWFNSTTNNIQWMSDHLHPQTCYHTQCGTSEAGLRLGDWRGLAINANGDLWVAGRWAAGLIKWTAANPDWYSRGGAAYLQAWGDPYYGNCSGSRPVFCTPLEGDVVDLSAVSVAPDGKVWFASGPYYGGVEDIAYGVAVLDGYNFSYLDPQRDLGMGETNVRDLIALPDGRIVFAGPNTGLVFYDPKTGTHQALRAPLGIPDDHVYRLELDTMVSPPALHVSTAGGAAVLRPIPGSTP